MYSFNCSYIEWQTVGSDERQMGAEIHYKEPFEETCDCGQNISITFDCWEYPVGAIYHSEITTDGVESLTGECTPDLW